MKKILLFVAPAVMSFAACSNQTTAEDTSAKKDSTSAFDLSSVKAAIMESNKAFSDAIVKGDSTTVANLYTSDATMLPPNMPKIENHEGILGMAGGLSRMGVKSFSLESTDVYGGPDLVTEEGKYTVGDASGKTLDEGKYIVLWKQEDGKWKLYRDIWNSNMPAEAAPKK
jgi:ketosteroid isomerase-like protein